MHLNWQGIIIGVSTFIIIGVFHPLVIKGEYYFGQKVNWAFAIGGIGAAVGAVFCESIFWSAIISVVAFSCFWSILEVKHQKKRVEKGWFPKRNKKG